MTAIPEDQASDDDEPPIRITYFTDDQLRYMAQEHASFLGCVAVPRAEWDALQAELADLRAVEAIAMEALIEPFAQDEILDRLWPRYHAQKAKEKP